MCYNGRLPELYVLLCIISNYFSSVYETLPDSIKILLKIMQLAL